MSADSDSSNKVSCSTGEYQRSANTNTLPGKKSVGVVDGEGDCLSLGSRIVEAVKMLSIQTKTIPMLHLSRRMVIITPSPTLSFVWNKSLFSVVPCRLRNCSLLNLVQLFSAWKIFVSKLNKQQDIEKNLVFITPVTEQYARKRVNDCFNFLKKN